MGKTMKDKISNTERIIEELHLKQLELTQSEFLQMQLTNKTVIKRHVDAFFKYLP